MLYEILMKSYGKSDKQVFQINGKKYTYRDLDHMVKYYANQVSQHNAAHEKAAAVFISKNIFSIAAILTCIYMGIPFIPIDETSDFSKTAYIFKLCNIRLIFGYKYHISLYSDKKVITETADFSIVSTTECSKVNENNLGYILFTSGSTGMPKGVMAAQKEIIFSLKRIQKRIQNSNTDIILSTLPLTFDYGLYQVFLSLLSGTLLILEPECLIQKIPALLVKYEVTAFPVVPTTFHLLIRTKLLEKIKLPKLRYICATGERWDIKSIQIFHHLFPNVELLPMYGLTECKRVSIMPYGRYDKVIKGSCGLPLDDVTVALRNKDETTGIGELVVIGDNVMEGYYGNPSEDSIVFGQFHNKKALYTGDLFYLDEEGFLYFVERINGLIKRRGIRISSSEIENYFLAEKSFLEVCAIGLEDFENGKKIVIAIYTQNKNSSELCQNILDKMPDKLKPSLIKFYNIPLPKNEHGKIDRKEIRRRFKDNNEI